MEEKKSNVQVYPVKVRVVPNCKLAKVTANRTETQYEKTLDGKICGVIEKKGKKNKKKSGDVITYYRITNNENYDDTDPLTFFEYSVLSVIDSAQLEGGDCITFAMILRGLTGKDDRESGNGKLHPDQRAAIMKSVEKLMNTFIEIDATKTNTELGYEGETVIKRNLLAAYFETTIINGQPVEDVIYFYKDKNGENVKSPIFEVADQRNQIIRYDTALLDVPNQNNTPLVITIKNYVMLRIMEIKKHKMTPTITLDDIFKKCRITRNTEKTRQTKETIDKFLAHLQQKDVIKSFNWKKQGVKIHGVEFTF